MRNAGPEVKDKPLKLQAFSSLPRPREIISEIISGLISLKKSSQR